MRHQVGRAAQAHTVLPARGGGGHATQARQDEGERAGPERIDQFLRKRGHVAGKVGNACGVGHVHDQRVVAGAALGCKICATAASLLASAARPYTVSVGRPAAPLRRAVRGGGDGRRIVAVRIMVRTRQCPAGPPPSGRARAASGVAAVMFRCPILRAARRRLPVQVQVGAGQGQHFSPWGVCAASPWAQTTGRPAG